MDIPVVPDDDEVGLPHPLVGPAHVLNVGLGELNRFMAEAADMPLSVRSRIREVNDAQLRSTASLDGIEQLDLIRRDDMGENGNLRSQLRVGFPSFSSTTDRRGMSQVAAYHERTA